MARIAEWEITEPYGEMFKLFRENTHIRYREDVISAMRKAIDSIIDARDEMLRGIEKERINAARTEISTASERLKELGGVPDELES